MPSLIQTVLITMLIPIGALVVGGIIGIVRTFSPQVRSATQHFAAGVVFAAVAVELLPDVVHTREPIPAMIGFSMGVAAMLLIRRGTEGATGERGSKGLLLAVGIDLGLDGLLLGIGFAAGAKEGLLLTIALTLEVFFLALATTATLLGAGMSASQAMRRIVVCASILGVGAMGGATVLSTLSGRLLESVLAFGCAALLYLVTEELLAEAHETPETPLITAVFFVGFLAVMVIEMIV